MVDEPPMGSDVYPENPEDQGSALGFGVSGSGVSGSGLWAWGFWLRVGG